MMKISVQSEHFRVDTKLVDYVEKKLQRFERVHSNILEADVHLKLQDTGARIQQKIVDIRLRLPGGVLLARETDNKAFEAAVDAAYDNLKRQLTRQKEKENGVTRVAPTVVEKEEEVEEDVE